MAWDLHDLHWSKALFFLKAATQHVAFGAARARRDFGLATKPQKARPSFGGAGDRSHFGASEMRHTKELQGSIKINELGTNPENSTRNKPELIN